MHPRYEILNQLGEGGEGTVWKAWDTRLQRNVAIKMLLPPEEREAPEAGDIFAEASALSALQHPNIISVYDVESDAETGPYVVMEFLNGENLEQTIRRGGLTPSDFISISTQVLEGLVAAHKLGMQHRDIKPSNIMLSWLPDMSFIAKLLDFGLAKFTSRPNQQTVVGNNKVLGSIYFMAPEQFSRRPLDHKSDLYSLGCVLYFSLTQRYPFDGDTASKVMQSHLEHQVSPLREIRPDIPRLLCDWVMWLIRRQPEHRPRDAAQALSVFRGVAAGELHELPQAITGLRTTSVMPTRPVTGISRLSGPVPRRTSSVPPAEKAARKPSPLVWIAVLCGLIVAGIAFALMKGNGKTTPPEVADSTTEALAAAPATILASPPPNRVMTHPIPTAPPITARLLLWLDGEAGTFRRDPAKETHRDEDVANWVDLTTYSTANEVVFQTTAGAKAPKSKIYRSEFGLAGDHRTLKFDGGHALSLLPKPGETSLLKGELDPPEFTLFMIMRTGSSASDSKVRRVLSSKCGTENKAWDVVVTREQLEAGIRKLDGKPSKATFQLPGIDDNFICLTFRRDGAKNAAVAWVTDSKGKTIESPPIPAAQVHGPLVQMNFGVLSTPEADDKVEYFIGDIATVLLYNTAISDTQRQVTTKYLMKRFFGI